MTFGETFQATFWANVAALALFAIPGVTMWAFLRDRNHRLRRLLLLRWRKLMLRIQFSFLVLSRKRKFSEYRSWYRSVTTRNYIVRLVSEAPRVHSQMMGETFRVAQRIVSTFDERLLLSPGGTLRQALSSMSMGDFDNPSNSTFDAMAPTQRAVWLRSQALPELARWSLLMDPDDRRQWLVWLKSSDGQIEIEMASTVSTKKEVRENKPDTD